jgi:hypothetical protein
MDSYGVPAEQLSDDDLKRQRDEAHGTREWALRRGSDEQFQRHTARMLELEQEYLRRQLKQQALHCTALLDEATRVSNTLSGLALQLEDQLDEPPAQEAPALPAPPAAASPAMEAIGATGSWAFDSHPDRLEAAPDHGMAKEEPDLAHRAAPTSTDSAADTPKWRGWWVGPRHQTPA